MKSLRLPKVTEQTKFLSFDLETNGLHGEAFAVGAVVVDAAGTIYDEFSCRAEIVGKVDEWVAARVLPVIQDMDITHSSYKHLRDHFWSWFVKAQEKADYVLVNNGYPVEYRFLLQCQEDDIDERYWQHPFPILELTSLLLASGQDIQGTKNRVMAGLLGESQGSPHHPVYDAKVAARAAFTALLTNN